MGTLVLRSHDPVHRNPNLRSRPRHRRRSPNAGSGIPVPENTSSSPGKNLVMGQVRILKRGEDHRLVQSPVNRGGGRDELVLSSTGWIGPDPEVVRQHVTVSDLYAGAACLPSPPPSSLPFPASLMRGGGSDAAASDLRRLLRI